jgi:hypothetical protein
MTMGVLMPILIGFAALSVDISYINMARTQSQNVADAASHAALIAYRSTNDPDIARETAEFIVSRNLVGNDVATLTELNLGEWSFKDRTFDPTSTFINGAEAVVSRSEADDNPLELFFAPLLGHATADVMGHGTAAGRTRQVMLVTDVSGSFANDIDSAREATTAFLTYMRDNPLPGDLLGHAVFAGRKTFPLLHSLASPTDDYASLYNRFQLLEVCSAARGELRGSPTNSNSCFTSQARGLHYALQEFAVRGDAREFQAVVLLTDGQANTHLSSNRDGRTRWTAEDDTEMLRDVMWEGGAYAYRVWECPIGQRNTRGCGLRSYSGEFDGGVHLWTVYFGSQGSNVRWLEDLVDFDGNRGTAENTTDPDEMVRIMVDIASSIPVVLTD